MRLRLVQEADFRTTEIGIFQAATKKEQIDLGPNDVLVFVSIKRNQVLFIWRPYTVDLTKFGTWRRGEATVFRSERLRLDRSTWSPTMIQNYAEAVGLQLDGLRRFEDVMAAAAKSKAVRKAAA